MRLESLQTLVCTYLLLGMADIFQLFIGGSLCTVLGYQLLI